MELLKVKCLGMQRKNKKFSSLAFFKAAYCYSPKAISSKYNAFPIKLHQQLLCSTTAPIAVTNSMVSFTLLQNQKAPGSIIVSTICASENSRCIATFKLAFSSLSNLQAFFTSLIPETN